jgi:hypothetical protein
MASTATRKRQASTPSRREQRVGDLTPGEFRTMMNALIDARLAKWVDPDAGLELSPEIIDPVRRQRAEFTAGKRGRRLGQMAEKYGVKLQRL